MDRIKKKPRFLSFVETNEIVKVFLNQQRYNNEVPVPIENIIEALGFDIIPSFQLNYRLGIEGFIIPKKKEIYIDKDILEHTSPNRYYSTLAHELGHYQLHLDYMSEFSCQDDYVQFLGNFNRDWLCWVESQAWNYARLLLLPSAIFPHVYQEIKNVYEGSHKINISQYEKSEPDSVAELLSDNVSDYFQVSKDLAKYRIINYLCHGI